MHGYLTRDGTAPAEFLRLAREELGSYASVELRRLQVVDAAIGDSGFEVICAGGARLGCRALLLATGVVDEVPEIEGLAPLYGQSVHHCPYCDGWEWRDQPIAAYGRGDPAAELALALTAWSHDLVLLTDGPGELSDHLRSRLAEAGIALREERVARLEGSGSQLERVVLASGEAIQRRALFFATGQRQHSDLPARLGCRLTKQGTVDTGSCEATDVPGLFVAGDASKEAQFVVVAAAEGAEAGMAINKALLRQDLADRDRTQNRSSTPIRASRGAP
jgi:thioredoxin reductase